MHFENRVAFGVGIQFRGFVIWILLPLAVNHKAVSIFARGHRVRLTTKIAEKVGCMKVRAVKVCTNAEMAKKARHIKPRSRANFQQSGFERVNSCLFKVNLVRLLTSYGENYVF